MEGRRRLTLLEQMSASSNRSVNDLLTSLPNKPPTPTPPPPDSISGLTLLDIIRDEEPKSFKVLIEKKDKKSWKTFKDRLRLKAANNSSWVSSAHVPTSDIHPVRSNHHPHLPRLLRPSTISSLSTSSPSPSSTAPALHLHLLHRPMISPSPPQIAIPQLLQLPLIHPQIPRSTLKNLWPHQININAKNSSSPAENTAGYLLLSRTSTGKRAKTGIS